MAIIRVSVARCEPKQFDEFVAAMAKSAEVLIPAIRRLHGCLAYDAGADRDSSSLVNVSVWQTLADAKQMDALAPMIEQGKILAAMGAVFERPIMNYEIMWSAVDAAARPM
jgi:quinol monooxygenase YgiN